MLNNLRNTHNNNGYCNMAIEDKTRAIKLKPDYVDAYYHRGDTYYFKYIVQILAWNEMINLNKDSVIFQMDDLNFFLPVPILIYSRRIL